MSAAAAEARVVSGTTQRRVFRHAAALPADISVLRSGVLENIPARTLNVGEGGLAAMVAAELCLGDAVCVEFRLPGVEVPLRARGVVRHQERLRCGIEFLELSLEQKTLIRNWTRQRIASAVLRAVPTAKAPAAEHSTILRKFLWAVLAVSMAIGGLGWWQWYRAWDELESRLPLQPALSGHSILRVPPADMERLLIHKTEPVYPEAARRAKVQGVVVVQTIIGQNGSVLQASPVGGPVELADAAADAVRWWRFEPYRVHGEAVEVETTVAVEFSP